MKCGEVRMELGENIAAGESDKLDEANRGEMKVELKEGRMK